MLSSILHKKEISCDFQLILENKCQNQEKYIKYLGVVIELSFSWKSHIPYILTKIKRSVGILGYPRVATDVLSNLCFFDLWNNCIGQHFFNNSLTSLYFTEKIFLPHDIYKLPWTLESYIRKIECDQAGWFDIILYCNFYVQIQQFLIPFFFLMHFSPKY